MGHCDTASKVLWYLGSGSSPGRRVNVCWSDSEPVGEQAAGRLFGLAQSGFVCYTYTSVDRWMWAPESGTSIHTHYKRRAIPNTLFLSHTHTHMHACLRSLVDPFPE